MHFNATNCYVHGAAMPFIALSLEVGECNKQYKLNPNLKEIRNSIYPFLKLV